MSSYYFPIDTSLDALLFWGMMAFDFNPKTSSNLSRFDEHPHSLIKVTPYH